MGVKCLGCVRRQDPRRDRASDRMERRRRRGRAEVAARSCTTSYGAWQSGIWRASVRDHVLQATALVNEVYLRLVDIRRVQWQDRAHFFAMAARLMRRVLVDFARARNNQKRGGLLHRVTFDENLPVATDAPGDLIAIDKALRSLAAQYERKSQVVELRFFGGLSVEETAEVLKISPRP